MTDLKKLVEQARGKSANEFWLATGRRPTDVIVELAMALKEKDRQMKGWRASALMLGEDLDAEEKRNKEHKNYISELEQRLQQPIAWRYRYTKPGVTHSDGTPWVGDWRYVESERDFNPGPQYQVEALCVATVKVEGE